MVEIKNGCAFDGCTRLTSQIYCKQHCVSHNICQHEGCNKQCKNVFCCDHNPIRMEKKRQYSQQLRDRIRAQKASSEFIR